MCSVKVLSFFGLLAAIFVVSLARPVGRLRGGQPVDNLRRFPHHVYIIVTESGQKCGGSVLNSRWVLTSASCVKGGDQLDLYFRKKHESDASVDFFAVSVNRDQVFVYPTNFDDIALVKVPMALAFSESLAPVNISKLPIEALRDRYTVMPGFGDIIPDTSTTITTTTESTTEGSSTSTNSTTTSSSTATQDTSTTESSTTSSPATTKDDQERRTDLLTYGMFNVLENRICKQVYGGAFDEYTQLCIESWGDNLSRPCDSDYGSGLIVGWPARSELVGLFSMYSPGCENNKPSIFTFTGKYLPWIESMISGYA